MWTFQKKFFLHQYQSDFNEGQQKINLIYFHKPSYETLIIGNSRTSYLNQTIVPNSKAFNLGINALDPSQYNKYIKYAQQHNSKKIKQIILTLDFQFYLPHSTPITTNILKDFTEQTESFLYRYKLLFSLDTLKLSFKNIRNVLFDSYKKRDKTYNEYFIADSYQKDPKNIKHKIKNHLNHLKLISYKPNLTYKDILLEIKNENKDVKFIVYISPLPEPVIKEYIGNEENFKLYKLWIKDIIDVFGNVHNFMHKNDITEKYEVNFLDATHFYPKIGDTIISEIFKTNERTSLNNFDIFINHANYESHMDIICEQFINTQNLQKNNFDIISINH